MSMELYPQMVNRNSIVNKINFLNDSMLITIMKQFKFYLFFLTYIFCLSNQTQAQKNIHILDIIYEALQYDKSKTYTPNLKGGFIEIGDNNSRNYQIVNPTTIIKRHPDAKKYLTADSTFVFKSTIELQGTVLGTDGDPSILFEQMEFSKGLKIRMLVKKQGEESSNEKFYGSTFTFRNIKVEGFSQFDVGCNFKIKIKNGEWEKLDIAVIDPLDISIDNCLFKNLTLALLNTNKISVTNSTINSCWIFGVTTGQLAFNNNIIEPIFFEKIKIVEDSSSYLRKEILGFEPFKIEPNISSIENFELRNNHFKSSEQNPSFHIESVGSKATIIGNIFEGNVRLVNQTSSKFEMNNNAFTTVSMMASLPSTPQNYVNIDWEDLVGKLVWKENKSTPTYFGKNELELADKNNFKKLISSYGKLVEIYKNNRNTEDANSAYLEMKGLEENRFAYVYKKEGGSDNLFRLKLHQLLSIYTEHGTNPAQAITASVWLIFLFSIIYFFFPSDWDKKSKPQLIADFRTLVQKNEYGYFMPFLKLAKGFLISLFNAFVLSVNSFVTLGFGRIPTHGFAKYICILEGFLGWFLLSIFIVSLINQVLF